MAIVQISRITQRKGLENDLPQPLAGAEFGWATDSRQLFIGNGTIEDGAPVVGNIEVLTEFSDILGFATAYTYDGAAAGYTAPGARDPAVRDAIEHGGRCGRAAGTRCGPVAERNSEVKLWINATPRYRAEGV